MLKLVVLLAVCTSVTLGAPPAFEQHPVLDGRIVGGIETTIEAHPYQVAVLKFGDLYGGGAIFSPTWVVTTAACVDAAPVAAFVIRAGSTTHSSGGQLVPAARIFIHANYSRSIFDNDIALIELAYPVTIASVSFIPLAPRGEGPSPGSLATITGWGATIEQGPYQDILREVQVTVVDQEECRVTYFALPITERMFCAGVWPLGGKDACDGDSGAPIVIDGFLTGLSSWGLGCARPYYPGVNTNIPPLRQWIDNVVAGIRTNSVVIEL